MSPDPIRDAQTGRRAYDDPSGMVVPLREYLEDRIAASHSELKTEMGYLRAEVATEMGSVRSEIADGKAEATREHAAVRKDLANLQADLTKLTAVDLRQQGARELRRTIWRAAAAIVASLAGIATIIAAFAGAF